ncbi:MAG: hypothetical protein ACD_13C00254G0007 [uncultured bacterium]|nr:MAG: hypothetical protein ACD_13C00254G0007 [uncultured bacterium]
MRRICSIKQVKKERKSLTKYVLFGVAGILAASSIFMTVETTTSSLEVSELRKKQSQLSNEKRNLENTLVRSLSMSDLEEKGSELGFVKPQQMVFVSDAKAAVAQLP